jgi:hypothetical protein
VGIKQSKLLKSFFTLEGIAVSPFFWVITVWWLQLILVSPFYFFTKFELEQEFSKIPLPPHTELLHHEDFSFDRQAQTKASFKTELSSTEIRNYYHQVLQELGWQYVHVNWNDYYCKGNFTTTIVYETSPTPFYRLELETGRISRCENFRVGVPIIAFAFSDVVTLLGCSSSWLLYILFVLRLTRQRKYTQSEHVGAKDSTGPTIRVRFLGARTHIKTIHVAYFFVFLSVIMILVSLYGIGHYLFATLAA